MAEHAEDPPAPAAVAGAADVAVGEEPAEDAPAGAEDQRPALEQGAEQVVGADAVLLFRYVGR